MPRSRLHVQKIGIENLQVHGTGHQAAHGQHQQRRDKPHAPDKAALGRLVCSFSAAHCATTSMLRGSGMRIASLSRATVSTRG